MSIHKSGSFAATTTHHSGSFAPTYRDREADAQAIKNTVNNFLGKASTAISNISEPVVNEGRTALNSIIDTVGDILPTAISTATAALAKLSYSGNNGNFQSVTEHITLTLTYYDMTEDVSAIYGSPCCKNLTLSGLSGFCQCKNAKVELSCTEVEQEAVEALLNRGVYIE